MSEPAAATARYATFAEFWPFYLREHSRPRTRALFYVATTLVLGIAVFAAVTGRWRWLLAMPVAGYFFAWLAHFWIDKNRPATLAKLQYFADIRHHIAHTQENARANFDTATNSLAGRRYPAANAGRFLRDTTGTGSAKRWLETIGDEFLGIIRQLC